MKHTYFRTIVGSVTLVALSIFLYSPPALAAPRKAKTIAPIKVTSKAFKEGEAIPLEYAYQELGGKNKSPSLAWSVDKKTAKKIKSYAITIVDLHPIAKKWVHYAAINFLGSRRNITDLNKVVYENSESSLLPTEFLLLLNSYNTIGYRGPNPPEGSGLHTYEITIYGLNARMREYNKKFGGQLSIEQFEKLIQRNVVARGKLRGTFEAPPSPPINETGPPATVPSPAPSTQPPPPPPSAALPQTNRIEISHAGVTPASLTIKAGSSVEFASKDGAAHWPASNDHPNHIVYPDHGGCAPIGFDACRPYAGGEIFSFIFKHKGSWGFHDHLNSSLRGTIIVE